MPYSPFSFLSALPSTISTVPSLSNIQLFTDTSQRLILAQGSFSLEAYQRKDFADLMLDLPVSIKGAVAKRQVEYLAGRFLGRLAMQQSGMFDSEVPQVGIGLLRAPTWPERVTGSITHHQYRACAVVLKQPLCADNFVGVDTELWLTTQQALEIGKSIHTAEELQILVNAGFTTSQATSLLFSAKEALFKAICPFVGEYFGFEAVELKACSVIEDTAAIVRRNGWLRLQLVADSVINRAPQQNYCCWFSCNELDTLTLVSSDVINSHWLGNS